MVLRSLGIQAIPTFPCKAAPPPPEKEDQKKEMLGFTKNIWYNCSINHSNYSTLAALQAQEKPANRNIKRNIEDAITFIYQL